MAIVEQSRLKRTLTRLWTGVCVCILIAVAIGVLLQHGNLWQLPLVGDYLQQRFYGDRNHPDWLTEYTTHPHILNNIQWHYGSVEPCIEAADRMPTTAREALGLYTDDTAICTKNPNDKHEPSCLALHELAHALDYIESRSGTSHGTEFRRTLTRLHRADPSRERGLECPPYNPQTH